MVAVLASFVVLGHFCIYFVSELCNKQATLVNDVTEKSKTTTEEHQNKRNPQPTQKAFKVSHAAHQFWAVLLKIAHSDFTLLCLWVPEAKFFFSMGGNLRINDSNTSASHVAVQHRWQGMHTRDADREEICSNILSFVHYNMLWQCSHVFYQINQITSSTGEAPMSPISHFVLL